MYDNFMFIIIVSLCDACNSVNWFTVHVQKVFCSRLPIYTNGFFYTPKAEYRKYVLWNVECGICPIAAVLEFCFLVAPTSCGPRGSSPPQYLCYGAHAIYHYQSLNNSHLISCI